MANKKDKRALFPEDIDWPDVAMDLPDCRVCGGGWWVGNVAHLVDRGSSGDGNSRHADEFVHAECMDKWISKNKKHLKRKAP